MGVDRRRLMQLLGGAAGAGLLPVGIAAQPASQGGASAPAPPALNPRARQAARIRVSAANASAARAVAAASANGDERRYSTLIASYSKGLPHLPTGEVEPRAFAALVKASTSGRPEDFDEVPTPGDIRQVNPLAAFAFTLAGPDGTADQGHNLCIGVSVRRNL